MGSQKEGFAPIILLLIFGVLTTGVLLFRNTGLEFIQTNFNKIQQEQVASSISHNPSKRPESSSEPSPVKANNVTVVKFPSLTLSPTSSPTPIPTPPKKGNIKGTVVGGYYSRPLAGATVTVKGGASVSTDASGNFVLSNLPLGKYTLTFSHPDYINFADWKDFEVKEGDNFLSRTPNGFLKDFKPTTVRGIVFGDHNGNNQKDSGEEGVDALFRVENEAGDNYWVLSQYVTADKNGNFSVTIDVGGKYRIVPTDYTFYKKPNSIEFVVDGYGGTKEYNFAYYPTASQAALILEVFNDKNENGIADSGEENIDFNYAEMTNMTTGASEKTWVSSQSNGGRNQVTDYGVYRIKLVAGDESWAYYYKITKAEDIVTVGVTSGDQTVRLGAHKLY